MKKTMAICVFLLGALILTSTAVSAQPRPDKDWKNWFGHIGGSYVIPQGDAGDVLDDGYAFLGGATYQPEDWPIGIRFELDWNEMDLSNEALDRINDAIEQDGHITGGDYSSWALTINGTFGSRNGKGFYGLFGVGYYDTETRVTNTGLVYYPPICSPWYWWCVPGGVGPGTIVRGKHTASEIGWNVGIGWAFQVGLASQLFIESRYHSVDSSPESTEYLPITIGYRW